jgi:hypothetical protein
VKHTCETSRHSKCAACVQFEIALWDAINRYAHAVGGDSSKSVYGNVPRMQAVVDVGKAIDGMLNDAGRCFRKQDGVEPLLPTNPDCAGTVGRDFILCGEEGYYCSDRCWTIGRLKAAHAQVAEYERQLGVYAARTSDHGKRGDTT